MELCSMLAGEEFTDRPATACPVIAGFLRAFNDELGDRHRQTLMNCASLVVDSRDPLTARARAKRCAELAVELHDARPRWRRAPFSDRRRWLNELGDRAPAGATLDRLGSELARLLGRRRAGVERGVELVEELVAMRGSPVKRVSAGTPIPDRRAARRRALRALSRA